MLRLSKIERNCAVGQYMNEYESPALNHKGYAKPSSN